MFRVTEKAGSRMAAEYPPTHGGNQPSDDQTDSLTTGQASACIHALTVDVEDYFHASALAGHCTPAQWDDQPCRVVDNTRRILRLLARYETRATFFILGWVADRRPALVREIAAAGHELGCHSFWHRLVYDLSPEEFRDDVRQARTAIEQAAGVAVTSYRAPSFSITSRSLWALEVLAEEGFTVDSSVFPVHHDRYGIPNAQATPHRILGEGTELIEFPPSVARYCGVNVPAAGGGYFRIFPYELSLRLMRRSHRQTGCPLMFYVHPWELDPGQPRLRCSLKSRLRHYTNLQQTEQRLEKLLSQFCFDTLTASLRSYKAPWLHGSESPVAGNEQAGIELFCTGSEFCS